MADKAISELISAEQITASDMFVLEQNGTAKKLTGQVLLNWLTAAADGHGGIQSIAKVSTNGLVDTYRITLADTTTFDFVVTNGKGITSVAKQSTSGLVDTYKISFNDGSSGTFTVTNGAKGDKGDNTYTWVKYASQQPTASSHSFGDVPDAWIGIYAGTSATAPTDWQQYKWYKIKGEQGNTGNPATLTSYQVSYQTGSSGTVIPSGSWSSSVPVVTPGQYLWTRTVLQFNTGSAITSYSVSRFGIDGSGAVSSVAGIAPDGSGNVPLTADNLGALSKKGGTMEGSINMNGQKLSGLNAPTTDDDAANMGFVNQQVKKAAPRNLLDNSDFTNPVNQRNIETGNINSWSYFVDRWIVSADSQQIYVDTGNAKNDGIGFAPGSGSNFVLTQRLPKAVIDTEKNYTAAYETDKGAVVVSTAQFVTDNTDYDAINFFIPTGTYVKWLALYEGEYTAETLPKYQPKGYSAELLECQRYFVKISQAILSGVSNTVNTVASFNIPAIMRIKNPTFTASGSFWVYYPTGEAKQGTASLYYVKGNIATVRLTTTSSSNYSVGIADFSATLSADL